MVQFSDTTTVSQIGTCEQLSQLATTRISSRHSLECKVVTASGDIRNYMKETRYKSGV
jgi:hypothetical protein